MIRVYLDNCCLQRHLDNQAHPRIRVETEALFAVLAAVNASEIILLSSEALTYEISRIPDETRRTEAFAILSLASEYLQVTDTVPWLQLRKQIISAPAMISYSAKLKPCPAWIVKL